MCGIVGYVGDKNCSQILIDGLKQLEYRGYDSAGIAVLDKSNNIVIEKKQGKVAVLEESVTSMVGNCGIGHTRWATHGKPSDINSHPHKSGAFAVVHNGIIENFLELKVKLVNSGARFTSETDTEVIAHLLRKNYEGDIIKCVKRTTDQLIGSFALAIICEDCPNTIVVAKRNNPLIIGVGQGENFIASDIPAVAKHTKDVYVLNDGDLALVTKNSVKFYDKNLKVIHRDTTTVDIEPNSLDKGNNDSYMIKEIKEIPTAVSNTIKNFNNLNLSKFREVLHKIKSITIVGCGTAYHSSIVAKYIIEENCRMHVNTEIASEYRYRNPIIDSTDLVIAVSQSGETADTIAAAKMAKEKGAYLAVISNVSSSSLCQIADFVFPTLAGVEIGVAATKSYNTQLTVFYLLTFVIMEEKLKIDVTEYRNALQKIPFAAELVLRDVEKLNEYAGRFSSLHSVFFIGRGVDYAVALEGSLKLKEISYIHSEGYAAGELKHGTLALIEKESLVISLITQEDVADKTLNAVHEVKARGATVLAITQLDEIKGKEGIDFLFELPKFEQLFMPIITVIPLQVFAYYMARARGNDPDKPRNLAKSVTVE